MPGWYGTGHHQRGGQTPPASTTCSTPRRRRSSPRATPWSCWPGKRRPRLFSFSGARWWIPLERWWKRFRASEEFREMDYLIPTINKDRTGFIPRPGTPDRSLRWLKDALGKQGAPVKDVAGSSCRIGHSRRTYRGTSASTWETGSRSPRRMSTPGRSDTWCAPSGTRSSRSSRPCNSRQEGRSESTSDMRTGRTRWSARFKEVPDTPPSNASWDVIPANKPAITKMAADEVPPPRGPLTVVVPPKLTGHRWSHSGVRLEAGTAQDFGAGGAGLPC